jgi:hypothetical protein
VRGCGAAFQLALALGTGCLAAALPARAQGFDPPHPAQQKAQLAPFAGWAFGGTVRDTVNGRERSFDATVVYGGALDLRLSDGWNVELLYSRQPTQLEGGLFPEVDVTLERYLAGVQEEKGSDKYRWFGTFYLGASRFDPGLSAFGSELRFTGGLGLGGKAFLSRSVGLRFEARGFYTVVEAEGGFICADGTCLFSFSGRGLWQGDVSAGLVLAF